MRPNRLITIILISVVTLSLSTCAFFSEYAKLERDAQDAYSRADYDTAVFMLARSLQINQDYEKSQILAADAFLMANRRHNDRLNELANSTDEFKYDEIVREYQSLINLHEAVRVLPPIRHPKTGVELRFEIINYDQELADAKKQAAESHYVSGDRLANSDSMADQKAAAKEFKRAVNFVPGYKDADQRYSVTRQAGIKRVAVFPFEDLSGKMKRYGAVEEMVVDHMVTSIMKDRSATEFLELISRDQLDRVISEQKLGLSGLLNDETAIEVGAILGVHEILTGKITQIIYSPGQTVTRSFVDKNRVVIRKEKYKDKEGKSKTRNIYGDVEARVKHYKLSTKAIIKGSYKIVDVRTSKLLKSETFEGKSEFNDEWVTYRGDERALSSYSRRLAKKGKRIAPVAEEMVSQAATQLANSLTATLKIYAR